MPSLQEVRTHAKCLRSTEQVRNYFRKYRAARKASSASVRASGSDSDSDGAAPTESISRSISALQSSRVLAAGGASKLLEPGISSQPPRAAGAVTTGGSDTRGILPFVFGSNGGAGIFLASAGGALAGLGALQAAAAGSAAVAAASASLATAGGGSSPRSTKTNAKPCCGPVAFPGQQQQPQDNSGRYVFAGGPVGTLRQTAPASSAAVASRPPAPLPPVAAAVSGPVISFSSGGQPQHSVHGPGPALSIGGGIVLRLPTLQRTASTGGGTSGGGSAARPRGSTPTKHSSPAPPAPAAKRQAIAQPACSSGQTSSVHLGEYGGAYPARYACAPTVSGASSLGRQTAGTGTAAVAAGAVATCVPPTITSGMRDSRSFSAGVNGAAAAAAGFPASANLSGSMGAGYVSAPSSCPTSAQHPAFHTNGSASATAQHAFDLATLAAYPAHHAMHQMQTAPAPNAGPLTAASESAGAGATMAGGVGTAGEPMMVLLSSPGSSPEAAEEIACDAAALSPTQAFFHAWEQNEMDDLLVDLPGDADGGADQTGSQARQEIASVAATIAAATAADSMTLSVKATATDVAAAAAISGGTDATRQAVTGLTAVNGSTAAAAAAVVVQGKTAGDAVTGGGGGDCGISNMDFFTEDAACGAAYGCGAGPGSQAPTAPAHSQPPMSANSQPLASAEYHPLTASLPAVTMTLAALPHTTNVPAHSSDNPHRQPAQQSHHFPRQQATSHDQQSLPGQGPGKAGMDAALRWWPDPNGGVGSGLPPIRTTLQADHVTCSKSQRTNDLPRHHHHQQLPTPTSAQHGGRGGEAVLQLPAIGGGGAAVAAGCLGVVAPEGGEGLSPASAHELFSILELPQLQVPVPVSKASGRQQQPQHQSQSQASVQPAMSQQQSQHNNLQGAAPVTSEPSSQPEGGSVRGGAYPQMPYPQAWPAPPYHSAPDPAAAAMGATLPGISHGPNAPAAAAAGPYQQSMCMPYPYGNAGPHYPPYGYCPPPPYGLPPHHPYYYHQMPAPPPPSGSGYDIYGWSPYHLPPHAIPYPGMPYHAYPMGPMMPPPPHQLTHGSTADCPSSAIGAMGSGHLEASSTRFRTTRQAPAPSGGGSGGGASSFIPPAPTAAEPLMPGRYVWQATGGGGLSKLRRAVSGQAVTEGGECNTSGGSAGVGGGATAAAGGNDAVSTMQSRIVPATSAARKRAVPQGSYCSNLNQSYSQSIGAARTKAVTVATADDAATCGGGGGGGEAEECVESRNPTTAGGNTCGGREHPAASDPAPGGAAAEQLMPPPPPRQPRSERAAQASAHAILTVENSHLSSGHTTAPALPPGLSSLPLPMPMPMGLHQPSLPTPTFTPAGSLYHTAPTECHPPGFAPSTSLPAPVLLAISSEAAAVTPPPAPRPPTCSDSAHERTAASVSVPPPLQGTMQLARAQQQQSEDIAAVAASTAAVEQSAAAATADALGSGGDGDRQEAIDEVGVYVCDDSDLLDLSNITAGLFSPPGSQTTRAPGTSRATGSREIAPSTATASAAATAATFAGGVGAGAPPPPPSLDATPNTAAATAAAAATSAFTPVSACTVSRSNAFAAPPRPATAVGTTGPLTAATAAGAPHSIDPSSHQKCPRSARSTDVFRALATPRTLCGSPLDCSVLASWLTSPAGMTSLDACTRPLGLLLGHLDEEGDVSVGGENRMHEGSQALDQVQEHTTEKSLESLEGPNGVATAAAATDGATVAAAELNNVASAGSGSGVVAAQPAAAAGDNGSAAGVDEDLGEDLLRTPVPTSGRSGTATAVANPADSAARATTAAAPDVMAHIRITFVPSRPPGSGAATPPHGKALSNDGGIIWHHHDHEQQQQGPCTLATKKGAGGGGGDGQADAGDSTPVDGAADGVMVAAEADVNSPLPTLRSSLAL
ncbi:hypothetical protein Vretimale_34 [Volvox reticuliferus]|nr:hypothetical protein Vretifemale_8468 [Volvox reticuliferus]GIL93715.1 hypothetical protein Vretimale_34 [Volvox reticuliferus]GIL93717.1 hypothetical protein Vretimale_34 [Volvox reticuliferus]